MTLPFLWLAFAAPLAWRRSAEGGTDRLRALILSVAGFCAAMLAVILGYFLATPRYSADFTPALALLAAFGCLGLERWAQRSGWTRVVAPALLATGLITATAGVLLSFDYHGQLLRRLQPQWWASMEQSCRWVNDVGRW